MTRLSRTWLTVLLCLQLGMTAKAEESDEAKEADKRAATVACQVRLSESLRAEGTPLMKALAELQDPSWALGGSAAVAARSKRLAAIARGAPNDVLVQWLVAANAKADAGLSKAAENLLRIEPDNGAAWLFPLQAAWITNDADGVTEALVHISGASRFDRHFGNIAVRGLRFLQKHPSACASHIFSPRPILLGLIMARAALYWPVGRTEDHGISDRMCGGRQEPLSVARLDACIAAGKQIVETGSMPEDRRSGNDTFLRYVAADDFAANSMKLEYLWHEYRPIYDVVGTDDNQTWLFEMDLVDTHNIIKVMERALVRSGKPAVMPEGWKKIPFGPDTEERLETRIP